MIIVNCAACHAPLARDAAFCSTCGTPAARLHPAFAEAEACHAQLRARYDAGEINGDQFKEAVEARLIDHGGRYWMMGVESGAWYAFDGAQWDQVEPPRTVPPGRATSRQHAAAFGSSPAAVPAWVHNLGERFDRLALVALAGCALVMVSTVLPWEWLRMGSGSASFNSGWASDSNLAPPIAAFAAAGLVLSLIAGLATARWLRVVSALAAACAVGMVALGTWYVWGQTAPNQHPVSGSTVLYWGRSYGVHVLVCATAIAFAGTALLVLRKRPVVPAGAD